MRNLLCSAAAVSMLAGGVAAAQPATTDNDKVTAVGEVVVTATRREESLRDIPATIAAVTADQLAATGPVSGTGDLLRTVPGVRFNDLQSNNLSEVSIRGSGTQRATGADSGVGLFVNGAYVGSSTLGGRNFRHVDHFDLERVEVLQGPQGGLYGRNSEFGVVNLVSAKPRFNRSGYVNATYIGKLDQTKITGVINEQLSDEVAIRIGAQGITQAKGFHYNPNQDSYIDDTDGWIGRAQIRFNKGPLDINFLVDAQDLDLPSFVAVYALAPGRNAQIPQGLYQDRYIARRDGDDYVKQTAQRAMILADYDLGWATLTSTSMATHWISRQAYSPSIDLALEQQLQQSGQLGAYPFGQVRTLAKDRGFYQDLHLAGSSYGDKLEWLVGADYLLQHDVNGLDIATSPCVFRIGASICAGTPAAPVCYPGVPGSAPCPTPFPNPFGTSSRAPLRNESYSAYGTLKYKVGDVTLAGELRYSHDDKIVTQSVYRLYTLELAVPVVSYAFAAERVNYTVTLSYDLPTSLPGLVYGKVGTGYRAGGVNARISHPAAPNPFLPTYGNEDTTSYEVGYKGNLARNIFLRFSAYASRTQDAITTITDGCSLVNACMQGATQFNINGGTVHARGVEAALDGRFQVGGGTLNVSANAARQRARYVDTPDNYSGLPIIDSSVAQIPKWTMSAQLNYRRPINTQMTGFVNLTYNGQRGGVQDTITPTAPRVDLSDLDVVSMRTGVEIKKVELAVFAQNLTNQTEVLLNLQANGVQTALRFNQPRTFGVNAIYRW
ncbi:TonB-dependent receptor [Caulobacter sp. NIBR2454]|uniref:TonB-dependent receptor n=1 Tax=Caulobacter sp. NIBR2454 TaxID=3015996 RepID=UPI0022B7508B|nr:TonB-dependent receptor [Caulobacter sp. NIBR2454]